MTTSTKPQRKPVAHLGLKLSVDELTLLHKIVRQINDDLHKRGVAGTMGTSRLIRGLIREEARRRGPLVDADATRIQHTGEDEGDEAHVAPPKSRRSKA